MASLSEIHMKNFKSFKNAKLKIQNGFTAILGPNGSGKSNTIDGICFVLGKTSAKSLRAGKFNQLITYHGGKRETFAEVTLYFNNKDRRMPVDSDKVGISRKVKINGDNNYYLLWDEEKEVKEGVVIKRIKEEQRKKVKKSDILGIIGKISLNADGFNIILQGDLIKIIDTTPNERRKIIDEISGVAEFDEKGEKATKELEKAREFIEKIDIRINEVKNNLEKLKREKEEAETYVKLNAELKATKYIFTSKRIEFLKGILDKTGEEIEALVEMKSCFMKEISEYDVKSNDIKIKLQNLISELTEKGNEEIMEIHKSIKEMEVTVENDKKSLNRGLDDLKNVNLTSELKSKDLIETRNKIENIRIQTLEKESEINNLKTEIGNFELEKGKLKSKVEESETQTEILKQQERKLSEKINEFQNEFYSLKSEMNTLENEINKKSFGLNKNEEIIQSLKNELEEMKSKTEDTKLLYKELEDVAVELEFSKKQHLKLENDKKEYQLTLDKNHAEYIKENARIKTVKDMEDFSLDRAVKNVIDAKLPGIIDIAGNLGKTDAEYRVAVENAGGNRLNYIVVKRMDDGARAIQYLKRNNLGRTTFLPLDRINGPDAMYLNEEGVIGRAIDLVEFNPEYECVFKYVFGNTLIVKDLNIAKKLSKEHKARFVTLEGEVIEPSGAMIGGHSRKKSIIKVDIDTTKLQKLAGEITELESTLSNTKDEIERLNRSNATYSSRKMELESRLKVILEMENRKQIVLNSNGTRIKELELENKKFSEDLYYLNDSKEEINRKIDEISKKISSSTSQRDRVSEEIRSFENSEYSKRIRRLEENIIVFEKKKNELENEIKRDVILIKEVLIPKISELNTTIKELGEKKSILENNIQFYKVNVEKNFEILKNKRERYEELTKDLRELTEKKECYENEIEKINIEKRKLYSKINQNETQINSLSIDRAKYETKFEEEERKLYICENIEHISEEITEKINGFDVDTLERHQMNLENSLKKLEPVNMRAIEDYQYIVDRYEELFQKRADYENEEKKYLQLIEEVGKRKKEVFMDTYLRIAENYEKIYGEIGGSGKLSLENYEEPFSGGLLIDASPMNKKLQSLDVMSGGEKSLTALAFLFAIQRLTPAPFYVLDEVDAALDMKNAALIGEMIKNASKNSQFIVISHREQMISKSDVIYGVCMEQGLSKIVGLKI
ncbi:chromosome segregation protein SMC [Methanococcus vannielii SB]|uniref:Chromosome partition protein Smc n=1 Tax=Methanococcus vannielii (strain ATCC 35089 / DSM 1224 / JCM 13029 / OCM 148 / SB) TaxID=406327 RepID=A6UQ42_METVS|nr:chromosome segregation protein SMC [Methanococcus vannielii]ABR54614.1 chromosome segregation protein SMC [Methanococcus vannielii SB]